MTSSLKKLAVLILSALILISFSIILTPQAYAADGNESSVELTVTTEGMFKPDSAALVRSGSKTTLIIRDDSTSYDKYYVGKAASARLYGYGSGAVNPTQETIDGKNYQVFKMDVSGVDLSKSFIISTHSKKNLTWYERTVTINEKAKTLSTSAGDGGSVSAKDGVENSTLKATTEEIETKMTEEQAKAYVDANDSPLLVAGLIGEIYIHPKKTAEEQAAQAVLTEKTAKIARYAYDKLSDEDKKNVPEIPDGLGYEYPGAGGADYFVSTGDASKDNPLNTAPDKKKEILVCSFGTSYTDSRVATIGGIEKALAKTYTDYSVRRAFTSQVIINHILARDEEKINTVREAMNQAKEAGVTNLIIQPTTLMNGEEYDQIKRDVEQNKWDGVTITFAEPLLGMAGDSADTINEDKTAVARAAAEAAVKDDGKDVSALTGDSDTAYVFMGHGTGHTANITYTQMQTAMTGLGYKNAFVGTVEGEERNDPNNAVSVVLKKVKDGGYSRVVLRPLMVVAGDHANNDMNGTDEDSWRTIFEKAGFKVEGQIAGLGQIDGIQQMYVAHTLSGIAAQGDAELTKSALKDYTKSVNDKIEQMKADADTTKAELERAKEDLAKAKAEYADYKAKVELAASSISGVKAKASKGKKITVSWKKNSKAEGYKVYRSTKKSKGFKAVATVKSGKTVKVTVKSGQKKGKTYYFKVRGYKKIAGKTCYSKYSKVVKVKAK